MGNTVFVFGAGATRGCSFVNPDSGACLPPLDRDFFTQLQRVQRAKHQALIEAVIKDIVRLFGTNFDVTLETAFAAVEQIIRMVAATRERPGFTIADLRQIRRRLLLSVAAVLEEALTEEHPRKRRSVKECKHMKRFVTEILRERDAILTFNYDCVLDWHLKEFGDGKWNPRYGYGFRLGPRGRRLTGDKEWQPSKPATREKTVSLFKLHGSLHFRSDNPDDGEYRVALKARPYTYQGRGMKFTIIPPEYVKRFEQGLFRDIWDKGFRAVARAQNFVFVGYSLPATDAHATALFRAAVGGQRLKALIVANPDQEARRRIRTTVQRGLSENTRVLSLNSFAEFVHMPRSVWDR